MVYGFPYPHDQELHVYRDEETLSIDFRHDRGNKYYVIEGEALQDFTMMGVPIFSSRLDIPPVDPNPSPSFTIVPEDSWYHAPTPGFGEKHVPSYGKPYGGIDPKMSRASNPLRVPVPKGSSYKDCVKPRMGKIEEFSCRRSANNARGNGKISRNQV